MITDSMAAEWIKFSALRSSRWTIPLVVLFTVGVSANAAWADRSNWPTYGPERRALFNPLRDAFPEAAYLVVVLVAGSLGVMVIAGEHAGGLIRTTFAAMPARRTVMAGKLLLLTAVMGGFGVLGAGGSVAASHGIPGGRDGHSSLGDPGGFRAVAATALLVPVCALIGAGIGAVIRHTAAGVATTVGVLLLLPWLLDSDRYRWAAEVSNVMPLTAWLRLIQLRPDPFWPDPYPATVTGSWLTYAAWPLLAAVVAIVVTSRRDV